MYHPVARDTLFHCGLKKIISVNCRFGGHVNVFSASPPQPFWCHVFGYFITLPKKLSLLVDFIILHLHSLFFIFVSPPLLQPIADQRKSATLATTLEVT
jgi:hypothetical protein